MSYVNEPHVSNLAEISYQLLENTATQSKDEFDALYKFTQNNSVGTQFELTSSNEWKAITDAKKIYGEVEEVADPHRSAIHFCCPYV